MQKGASMFNPSRQSEKYNSDESGFVLVSAVVVLLVLTLLGMWALGTSTSELQVAGSSQQVETQFNVAEGGAYSEAGKVGFNLQPFYQISNPSQHDQLLIPNTDAAFDPGNDTANLLAGITRSDPATWPWENLLQDYTDDNNDSDYRYLTTYLYPDIAPMGYDPGMFSGYKFRIQGAAPLVVELGGTKVGVKASL